MGWLNDLNKDRIYHYQNKEHNLKISGTKAQLDELVGEGELDYVPGDKLLLQVDGGNQDADLVLISYAGFDPIQLGIVTKVVFEKNGRKAVRIKDQNGKTVTRSMSRENLLNGKGITITGEKRDAKGELTGKKSFEVQSSLTKACREKSTEVKKHEVVKRVKAMQHHVKQQAHFAKEKKKGNK